MDKKEVRLFGIPIWEMRSGVNVDGLTGTQIMELIEWGKKTKSGESITAESSLEFSAVYGAVRIIAKTIASLEVGVYKRSDEGTEKADHELNYRLGREPSEIFSKFNFWERVCVHMLLHGNSYVLIQKNDFKILDPLKMLLKISPKGLIFYSYSGDDFVPAKQFRSSEILHFQEMNTKDIKGKSPIEYARENIGTGIAAMKQQGKYFGGGSRFDGFLKLATKISTEAYDRLKGSWKSSYAGVDNAYTTPILEEGMDYIRISDDPSKAQTNETRRFTVEEVARVFGVPLHLLQDLTRSTNNNIEHQSIEFVQHCIRPRIEAIEDELDRKLLTEVEKRSGEVFIEFNIEGLLRGDINTRMTKYRTMFNIGAMTPNEIRAAEKMKRSAQDGSDDLYLNLASSQLTKIEENEGSKDV